MAQRGVLMTLLLAITLPAIIAGLVLGALRMCGATK